MRQGFFRNAFDQTDKAHVIARSGHRVTNTPGQGISVGNIWKYIGLRGFGRISVRRNCRSFALERVEQEQLAMLFVARKQRQGD